jgi:hypothetical protein
LSTFFLHFQNCFLLCLLPVPGARPARGLCIYFPSAANSSSSEAALAWLLFVRGDRRIVVAVDKCRPGLRVVPGFGPKGLPDGWFGCLRLSRSTCRSASVRPNAVWSLGLPSRIGTVALTICRPVAGRGFKSMVFRSGLCHEPVCHLQRPSNKEIRIGNVLKLRAAQARDVVRPSVSCTSLGEVIKLQQS